MGKLLTKNNKVLMLDEKVATIKKEPSVMKKYLDTRKI